MDFFKMGHLLTDMFFIYFLNIYNLFLSEKRQHMTLYKKIVNSIIFLYSIRLFMYSNDLKIKAINLYYKLNSYRKVQELLDIGKSTVQRWVSNNKKIRENVLIKKKLYYSLNYYLIMIALFLVK